MDKNFKITFQRKAKAGLNCVIILCFCFEITLRSDEKLTNSPTLPPVPQISSPVAFFRELLETNQQAREKILSEKPPEQRKLIEAKISEYQSLPPDQRQLRLFMTELRWYLITVLKTDATIREQVIEQIPLEYKNLIKERLVHWQKLPPDIQKELLENELALHFILRITNAPAPEQQKVLSSLNPQQQARILEILKDWNKMPDQRKKIIMENFRRLFELSESEQESALKILPPAERLRMENTLKAFSNLPKEEKERCIQSFKKFATMDEKERDQFLKNAMRWIEMSPEERKAWRDLVRSMQSRQIPELPPLPPGMIHNATAATHSLNLKTN